MAASVAQSGRSDKHEHKHKFAGALLQLNRHEVDRICREKGHHFRDGKLPPGRTVQCFGWQILMGNVSCDAVVHSANGEFTGSAYCQARQRLPLEVLKQVSDAIAAEALAMTGCDDDDDDGSEHLWLRRHRTFLIDGSSTRLPDSQEVREYFGISGNCKRGCSYPTAHLLLLVGAGGVAIDCLCSPLRTGDMTHASKMHRHLQPDDVLIGDEQFSSFFHLYTLQRQQLQGLFPVHHSRKVTWGRDSGAEDGSPNRRFVKTLGWRDQLVEYRKPTRRPKWMSKKEFASAPQWILVREVRREAKIGGVRRDVTLVSTLTDPAKYPAKVLVKLLGERWSIELNLRSLKTTMGAERLHCKTLQGVKKELLMYVIVYNLVRLLMLKAAARQRVRLDRISFSDALARLRYGSSDWEVWVDLKLNPLRPGRVEPRVVKRRPKPYPTMGRPRDQMRRWIIENAKRRAAA